MCVKQTIPLIFFMLLSCTVQEICDDDEQPEAVVKFKTLNQAVISDSILTGVTLFGIRQGSPDSLLYDSVTLSGVSLPLDPGDAQSAFVLQWNDLQDTIRINHLNELYLKSYTCGFTTLFNLEGILFTGNRILDAEILNPVVEANQELDEAHIWIYF